MIVTHVPTKSFSTVSTLTRTFHTLPLVTVPALVLTLTGMVAGVTVDLRVVNDALIKVALTVTTLLATFHVLTASVGTEVFLGAGVLWLDESGLSTAGTVVQAVSTLPVVFGTAPAQGLFVGAKGFVAHDTLVFVHDWLS